MKVKIITSYDSKEMEREINDFIENGNKHIIDIKLTTNTICSTKTEYTAMIIY